MKFACRSANGQNVKMLKPQSNFAAKCNMGVSVGNPSPYSQTGNPMNTETKLKGMLKRIHDGLKSGSLDANSVSEKLKEAMLKYLEEYADQAHAISECEMPRIVTHYTSIHTLVSMLLPVSGKETNFLRMYDSVHSNDPGEGGYLNRYLSEKHSSLIASEVLPAYIASFVLSNDERGGSEDNLAFWRTYGKDGEGCSLSLPASRLRKNLRKVRYGDNSVADFERNLEFLFDNAEINSIMEERPETKMDVLKIVRDHMEEIRYLYKSGAYEYENECRFVLLGSNIESNDVRFECLDKSGSQARIRHYCEHPDLKIENILCLSDSKIVIGPCVSNPDDVKYCIETLLKRAELYGPSVDLSRIEYRKP